ncbi:hypothetical protein QFZ49_001609 [Streptomyces turgidiscabies]|uniref:Response regulator n=1 Tax=Streptomyces turgidiscabies TaxID=85558 RepID=A0ABU0RI81_9ACTN|nr:hypothetical protein [Streptomyces turgidiscabies]
MPSDARILIVDNHEDTLYALESALAPFGYRTLAQCSTLQGGSAGHPAPGGPKGRSGWLVSPCRTRELSDLPPDGREVRPAEAT